MPTYKKTFILDSNVIIHEPKAIFELSKNNTNRIVIPITVLEELDQLKTGTSTINYNTRDFIRILESGTVFIEVDINIYDFPSNISLKANKADNKILACAYAYGKKEKNIILITKDINLRIKAKALNVNSLDFNLDNTKHEKYSGYSNFMVNKSKLDTLYKNKTLEIPGNNFVCNQYLIVTNEDNPKQTALAKYNGKIASIDLLPNRTKIFGINPKNVEQIFAIDALLDSDTPLVALTGLSGSGKTLLSLATALHSKRQYHQIYITRQIVSVGNDIGFLPGTAMEKMAPYMEPFYDNLKYLRSLSSNNKKIITEVQESNKLEVAPITYMRGRSIPNVFLIFDEVQNSTTSEIKTVITRAGEGTKIILLGDIDQIDAHYLNKNNNGLTHVINKFKGNPLFSYINLVKGERSKLAEEASKIL